MRALDQWNPEAGLFHTATKHVRYWSPQEAARRWRVRANDPMPSPLKSYRGASRIKLPPVGDRGICDPCPGAANVASLLVGACRRKRAGFSARTERWCAEWVRVGRRNLPLKTSPSGGARHPIEAYIVVRNVRGLARGCITITLANMRWSVSGALPRPSVSPLTCPPAGTSSVRRRSCSLRAVLKRQLWRYPYSRAYRAALIEVGHVGQTFCLAAAALKLAPFSLMGLVDALIERDLGIDGITETVLYAAGVGRPPTGSTWAPRSRGTLPVRLNPRLK